MPPPDLARLHLSQVSQVTMEVQLVGLGCVQWADCCGVGLQVTLGHWNPATYDPDQRCRALALYCKTQDLEPIRLCLLEPGSTHASSSVDLVFDQYTEFSLQCLDSTYHQKETAGTCSLHLSGYYVPDDDEGELPERLLVPA